MLKATVILASLLFVHGVGSYGQMSVQKLPVPQPVAHTIVWVAMKEQPMADAAELWQPALRRKLEEIDLSWRALASNPMVPPDTLMGAYIAAQTQSAEALNTYRQLVTLEAMRPLLLSRIKLQAQVAQWGGRIVSHVPFINSFAVSIAPRHIPNLLRIPEVAYLWQPPILQPQIEISVPTLLVPSVWDEGYTAPNWAPAVLDTGVNHMHTALTGRNWIIPNRTVPGLGSGIRAFHDYGRLDTDASGNPVYNDDYMSATDLVGHGTQVSGPIFSRHTTRKGTVFFAGHGVILKAGYRTRTGPGSMNAADALIALDWVATQAPLPSGVAVSAINFSFGGATNLDYDDLARAFDAFIYTYQIPLAIAAGNAGGPEKKLLTPSTCYNGVTVAASDDRRTMTRTDDIIAGFSSRGPTIAGRKKPDVTVPGSSINTTTGSTSSFASVSGTSVATPHATGALTLLHDLGIHDPLLLKAVLINSAEDRGAAGWDKDWGWGYVDMRTAMQHVINRQYGTGSLTRAGTPGSTAYFRTRLPAGGKVTLVWHRRAGFSPSVGYINLRALANLTLTLIDETTSNVIGVSNSTIDNVQQVVVSSAYSRVLVKVEAVSAFDQYVYEPFALASSGVVVPIASP